VQNNLRKVNTMIDHSAVFMYVDPCQALKGADMARKREKISPKLRAAIYLRDRMVCIYCGCQVIPFAPTSEKQGASLEHLECHSNGGADSSKNLVTCCVACNRKRGNLPMDLWECRLSYQHSIGNMRHPDEVRAEVKRRLRRKLPLERAAKWIKSLRNV
jgi:hypothetical protein